MLRFDSDVAPPGSGGSNFQTTRWSLVLAAGKSSTDESRDAIEILCKQYWYPLYVYVRGRGHGADRAQDLTQGFFARLLEQKIVRNADPQRGKFRSYLLGALKHFLSHEWSRAHARKRGSGREAMRLEFGEAETRYSLEPAHEMTAEKMFERQWALTVLELALKDLGEQSARNGKERHFSRLKGFLAGGTASAYREAGDELGLNEGAVRVMVHRLRRKYRELVRGQIRMTVGSADDVEDEVRHLFASIGS
jgi:RNA polymerase sigma factor (sigma-70 family)